MSLCGNIGQLMKPAMSGSSSSLRTPRQNERWSGADVQRLLSFRENHCNWTEISEALPGRSVEACKQRFKKIQSRSQTRLPKRPQRWIPVATSSPSTKVETTSPPDATSTLGEGSTRVSLQPEQAHESRRTPGRSFTCANNAPLVIENLQSLPTSNNRARLPPMSTLQDPMRSRTSRPPPNTAFPTPTPRHLPQTAFTAGTVTTAPTLPRTRALAKAKLMSNHPGWRRAVHQASGTRYRTTGIQQTLFQHTSTLLARAHVLEEHVDALNKSLERWDPITWDFLRDMVQELREENGPRRLRRKGEPTMWCR